MSRVEPGEVRAQLPASPPEQPDSFDADLPGPGARHPARALALAASELLRLLPVERQPRVRAGRLPQHRPRRSRAVLAVEPRAQRARGGGHGLDAPDGRALARLERRDPGHGLDEHAGRADLRPGAQLRLLVGPCGLARRGSAAGRLRVRAQPQLGGEGGAPRRLRPRQRARHRGRRALRHAACRPGRRSAQRCRARSRTLRGGRHDRHHHDDGPRSARGHRGRGPGVRPLAARRRRHGGLGDDPAGVPLDVAGHRGRRLARPQCAQVARAPPSTARSTTSATPSTSCAS